MADFSTLAFTDTALGSSAVLAVNPEPFLRELLIRCLGPGELRLAYSSAAIGAASYFLVPDDGTTYRLGIPAGAEIWLRRDSSSDPVIGYTFVVTQSVPNLDMGN